MAEKYLCVHGHFYQPPRENPWIEEIERQDSAAPWPDWNERIYHESYLPNARARVLDDKGRVLDIANNYEKMNFNFGPTLFSWLERKHPETYQKIIEADRLSAERHGGHGNAIAQAYNHMIMPLATRRDKVTQTRWGIEDFRHRFGRAPEALWLPETACDRETLEVLMAEGLRYVILAPNQSRAVRPIGHHDWQDVSAGQIDPRRPYRYFHKSEPGKFIDIFFYDGPISQAMGFENLLFDAKYFAGRIDAAIAEDDSRPQLIHVATDGETYGHHKAFGDRVLAYLMNVEAPRRGYKVTNYAEFLDICPPEWEVQLKEEESGGTSWSCAHGVGRWKEHCGCRGGGPGEWNQHWRKPLRDALDWLRDRLAELCDREGSRFFNDVWEARDAYIKVVLDHSEESLDAFFSKYGRDALSPADRAAALKFMECQRHAMLMYTSCGWFFTEISGIETIQILEYAARALQLAGEVSKNYPSLEGEFAKKLAQAESNVPEFKNGREIYEKWVQPKMVSLESVTAFFAIESLVGEPPELKEPFSFYSTRIQVLHQRKEASGDLNLNFGAVKITSQRTLETEAFVFIAVHMGLYEFRCSVKKMDGPGELEKMEKEFFDELHSLHIVEMLRKMDDVFGETYYALKDLPMRERRMIIRALTKEETEKISGGLERLYDDNRRMNEVYRSVNLPIPEQIRYAAQHTLERRLRSAVQEMARIGFPPQKAAAVYRILESAKSFDVKLRTSEEVHFLSRELEKRARSFAVTREKKLLQEASHIIKLAKKMKIELDIGRPQEYFFSFLKHCADFPEKVPADARSMAPELLQIAADLNINTEKFKKVFGSAEVSKT